MKTAYFTILTLLISISFSFGQAKTEQFDELINLYTEYGDFNGSVLIAEEGRVIYKKGFGMANMEWDIPNQSNTKHRLGSITKQFTAMLIVQLVEAGKLKLDAPITTYLPYYPKSTGDKITTHHLLTHTSGLPNYTSFPDFFAKKSRNPYTPKDFVKEFSDLELDFTPGERFSYSNSGYFLLGCIIEEVTGKTYEQVLQEKIFTPLKMNDTGYDHHDVIMKNRATGYEKRGNSFANAAYLDMSIPYAAGSLYSTVEDLYLWDQALYNEKLVSMEYINLSFEKHIQSGGRHYGYGWMIGEMEIGNSGERSEMVGHGGGINGFNTLITRIPASQSLVLLLNNTGGAPLGEMTAAINGILHGKTYDLPKESVASAVMETLSKKGIAAGIKHFETLKEDDGYKLSEDEMNAAGYQLLNSNKVDAAIAMFKLNVETFPKSFNVYDSYGEALMKQGSKEEAIKNYRKSVELNPANQHGIDMLKEMGVNTDALTKEVIVPSEVLESYVGDYQLMPELVLTIIKEGNQIKAKPTGQPITDLLPKSENVFYVEVIQGQLTFNKNAKGEVESVTLLQGGREVTGKKLLK